jgi:hypothetical protein
LWGIESKLGAGGEIMEKVFLYTLTMAGTLVVAAMTMTGVKAHSGPDSSLGAIRADGAFRDGVYLGKLDAANGRKPHLTSGRWSNRLDRASFIAGYQSSYQQTSSGDMVRQRVDAAHSAEQAGFQDGMADGFLHRQQAKPFQLVKTENYRRAMFSDNAGEYDNSRQSYRDAYTNGYQQAYYGDREANLEGNAQ